MLSSAISSSETFCKTATGSHFGQFLALYKLPGAVYVELYEEPLDQSDCWKLFVQL